MKKNFITSFIVLLVAVMFVTAVSSYFISKDSDDKKKYFHIADEIEENVLRKIRTSYRLCQYMAEDEFLRNFIRKENELSVEEAVENLQPYLANFMEIYSFSTVDFLSEKTHRYYKETGVHKIFNPDGDNRDLWYRRFRDDSVQYTLAFYLDRKDESKSQLFINYRMTDSDGTFLGVTSIGLFVNELQEVIKAYEKKYNVKVSLVSNDSMNYKGIVMLDSQLENCGVASLKWLTQTNSPTDEFRYLRISNTEFAVTHYVKDLNWYFVMQSKITNPITLELVILLSISSLIILIAGLILYRTYEKERNTSLVSVDNKSDTDFLTGLPNRNFFKETYGERGVFNTTRYQCMAVFDIDFFKEANDSMNGDGILLSVVDCAKDELSGRGLLLRWGGDEFLVLMELSIESAYAVCREFCRKVENTTSVTVSVGLVKVRLQDTVKQNYYRAARCCYQVKEMGGNGVKKESDI